jgi:hypothetical protein
MTENERIELEAENDGYRNEFQRAYAHARMTTSIPNHRGRAAEFVKAGKVVVLACAPVYCRATDAILGESAKIILVVEDRAVAKKFVTALYNTDNGEMGDEHYEILPHEPTKPADNDETPF